ncbi:unnamed protein product, partial [Rotaria sp. Silwood2]
MSSISIDASTLQINSFGLQNLMNFIFVHERTLKEFGAIKIQLSSDCALALKKRQISLTCASIQQITKVSDDEPIYFVQKRDDANVYTGQRSPIKNEETFWCSLSNLGQKFSTSGVSLLPNKSFFYEKQHGKYFSIHRIPRKSLLRLSGTKITNQFVSSLTRAHGPGAIFPLSSVQQRLFLLVYHHQGGPRHWYIIPACERETLQKILQRQNSTYCLEHGELMINPVVFDKYHIRYHRIIQYPNEFVILSAGALSQSFTLDASWSESIPFALPSWIEEGHATARNLACQCNINFPLSKTIDVSVFRHELIQKYIDTHLNIVKDGKTSITQ